MDKCKNLNEVRENINKIDVEIVKLIARRSGYVKQAAEFKKNSEQVKAPNRVEKIIEKVRNLAVENNLNPDIIESVYRNMINEFINMEMDEHKKIKKES